MLDKSIYSTVLCQEFSPCGKYMVAGNIYSQIAVFDLDRILNPVVEFITSDYNNPKFIHNLESNNQICSFASTDKFLIVGTIGEILGYTWKSVLSCKLSRPSWSIKLSSKSSLDILDVNSLWVSDDGERLYAGCGDNKVHVYNLEDGSLVSLYEGHTQYIHCIHGKGKQLVSASEDGCVKFWDARINKSHNSIEPHKNDGVARPEIGKWVGSVAIGDDWIVCGGGPRLSLWHVRSLDAVTVFDLPDHGIHVSYFFDDCVVAGGTAKHFYQLSYSGEVKIEIPVSATTVYSAIMRKEPNTILSIAGSSPDIDLCTTFNYKDQVLHFQ